MLHLTSLDWFLAFAGAYLIGLSKTGIAGIGILAVVIFALAFPGKQSPGIVLPILICADVIAVSSYWRHVVWPQLLRLFPWTAVGVVVGYEAMKFVNDHDVSRMIGFIAFGLTLLQIWRKARIAKDPSRADEVPHKVWFALSMGILAGFATMVANGAGPIMVLYLLATGLPKMEFMGTSAIFFFTVNCFKVPFQVALGQISLHTLPMDALLAPLAILGAVSGRLLLPHINQKTFENIAIVLTIVAGLKLIFDDALVAQILRAVHPH
ncbi:MAG: sulfite exporter TauE/SafE family protein [Capsulimonadaceae bacterium]|nr:sulfite exporter TauE/SafE family protein [Capsulimonadaceae bacterium]